MKIKITNIDIQILNPNQPDRPDYLEAKTTVSYNVALGEGPLLTGTTELKNRLSLKPMIDEITKSIINGIGE